jgi:DNA-binding transcriptional MerR regulator
MWGEASEGSGDVASWPAGAVARHLGVAVSTLRSWSRRYGLEPSQHTPGRHRRYTSDDVARLENMLGLIAGGMAPAQAAHAARSARAELSGPTETATDSGAATVVVPTVGDARAQTNHWRSHPQRPESSAASTPGLASERVRSGLLAAALRLDSSAITDALAGHLASSGVVDTWDMVCLPVLTELGERQARGAECVDAEHLLSWAIATTLHRVPEPEHDPGARLVLLACAAREWHTLALDALRAALAENGTCSRMLGAATPTTALMSAAARIQPGAIVVWAHDSATAQPRPLAQLARAHTPKSLNRGSPAAPTVIAAGPGWDAVRLPLAVTHAQSLRAALLLALGATRSAPLPTA